MKDLSCLAMIIALLVCYGAPATLAQYAFDQPMTTAYKDPGTYPDCYKRFHGRAASFRTLRPLHYPIDNSREIRTGTRGWKLGTGNWELV